MVRSACALASSILLATTAACVAGSPYGSAYDNFGGGSADDAASGADARSGNDARGGGKATQEAAAPDDTGPGVGMVDAPIALDAGVLLDAAMPSNCTVGAAGLGALVPIATMAPGTACVACHAMIGKPLYVAGTVYPTYHEDDLCLGVTGVEVEVVDDSGATHTLDVNSSGNFYEQNPLAPWPSPWKVSVVRGSARRSMVAPVLNGDCNSCHTAAGANSAQGRIIGP